MERIRRFFRKLGKGLGKRGYTLLEVAAVVAVTGTLAAVAMPVVADKIVASKVLSATEDAQYIRNSILNFLKDTGVPPFYTATRTSLALPKENTADFEYVLSTKDGVNPTFADAMGWPTLLDPTSRLAYSLEGQLIDNSPAYPTMGISAWKGPYIPSLKKDPWGNRYLVTIKWLAEPVSGFEGIGTYQKAVFVISAGPNGIIETKFSQKIRQIEATAAQQTETFGFTVDGDDIVSRIN